MKREFMIERQGKPFVLFAGLLDEAHEKGLASLVTEAVSVSSDFALFRATVTLADGRVFVSHGDATPGNVGRNIAPHFVRMGETRAKARALRDALNIGATALEEVGEFEEEARPQQQRPPPASQPASTGATVTQIRPAQPIEGPPPPQTLPQLLQHPDVVDDWQGDQLVEACALMAARLAEARIATGPLPEPRTLRSLRGWYRTGYGSLTAPGQPPLLTAPARPAPTHYDEGVPSSTRRRSS